MSDPAPQTESTSVKPAPATFDQKLGCGVILLITIVIGLVWWAISPVHKPEQQSPNGDATKAARNAAAPKYTMFTPPPVDEHLAQGGEVWARIAPTSESADGTGYRQFWLLSADRKTFVALITVTPAEQSTPLASQRWFDTMPIGDSVSKPSGGGAGSFRFTPSLSTSAATLTITSDSTQSAPDGPLTTKTESVTTFTFPDDPSVPAAVGEERTTVTVLKNGKPLADPKHVTKREQFHQIKKPNPPSAVGKGK
jgi:hypothetical protein